MLVEAQRARWWDSAMSGESRTDVTVARSQDGKDDLKLASSYGPQASGLDIDSQGADDCEWKHQLAFAAALIIH